MSKTEFPADSNPYRSPETLQVASDAEVSASSSKLEEIGRVIVTWEKLRLLYNAIGIFPTALIGLIARPALIEVAFCAFMANLCFCLGPLIDGYLTWFGFRCRAVTVILFVLGTLLMMMLAVGYALWLVYSPF